MQATDPDPPSVAQLVQQRHLAGRGRLPASPRHPEPGQQLAPADLRPVALAPARRRAGPPARGGRARSAPSPWSQRRLPRAALQLLAEEGLVIRKTKVGTTALGSTLLPLNDLLTDQDRTTSYRIHTGIETSIIEVPEMVRAWLALDHGSSSR